MNQNLVQLYPSQMYGMMSMAERQDKAIAKLQKEAVFTPQLASNLNYLKTNVQLMVDNQYIFCSYFTEEALKRRSYGPNSQLPVKFGLINPHCWNTIECFGRFAHSSLVSKTGYLFSGIIIGSWYACFFKLCLIFV